MSFKDPAARKSYQTAWYRAHKERRRDYSRAYGRCKRLENREFVNSRKTAPCLDCGVVYPPHVMHFDHRPGEHKILAVSTLTRNTSSKRRLLTEIAKCDVVCANCHAVRTYNRWHNLQGDK